MRPATGHGQRPLNDLPRGSVGRDVERVVTGRAVGGHGRAPGTPAASEFHSAGPRRRDGDRLHRAGGGDGDLNVRDAASDGEPARAGGRLLLYVAVRRPQARRRCVSNCHTPHPVDPTYSARYAATPSTMSTADETTSAFASSQGHSTR